MGNYPLRSMTASLSRTAVAVAALAVSVSATAGVGIMIGSFRLSVENWLGNTLQSDVYISADFTESSSDTTMPQSLINNIESLPSVSGVRLARMTEADTNLAPVRLLAIQGKGDANLNYEFIRNINQPTPQADTKSIGISDDITDEERIQLLFNSDSVIVSEPFARKNNTGVGSTIDITTDRGIKPYKIAGVFTNYTTGKGLIVMSLPAYQKSWNDRSIDSVGVNFSNSEDAANTANTCLLYTSDAADE